MIENEGKKIMEGFMINFYFYGIYLHKIKLIEHVRCT